MAHIDDLKRKLAAREGKSEYKRNCEALREEIALLENGRPDRGNADVGEIEHD